MARLTNKTISSAGLVFFSFFLKFLHRIYSGDRKFQNEVPRLLHLLPALSLPWSGLCLLRVFVVQSMEWRLRLGRIRTAVQLASGADGVRSGGGVRHW